MEKQDVCIFYLNPGKHTMAVIGVEPAVKYPFVLKGMQTRRKGQCNAELTLSLKPLITPITAIVIKLQTKFLESS